MARLLTTVARPRGGRVSRTARVLLCSVAACAALTGLAGASAAPLPRVTLIGDSVSSAISLDSGATAILGAGIDLQLQAKACRRLAGVSCPESDGTVPPTALTLINSLGHALGPTVIMAVGYNDPEPEFQSEVQEVLAALHQQGVQHILWMTLRAERHPYLTMNDEIRAAAAADPSVTVVDWNKYSRSHPEWFQADGIHPAGDGAEAMATLLHRVLVDLKIAPGPLTVVAKALPAAHERERYAASFAAAGGTPPYRWSPVTLPAGFSVTSAGTLEGRPGARAGVLRLIVRVTDATGTRSARAFVLHVLR